MRGRKADGAGEVFDHIRFEAEPHGVEDGEADAEIEGQAAKEEALQTALAQKAGEAGGGVFVVLLKGRVAVDAVAKALAEDEFGVGDVEGGGECGAGRALEAVDRPQRLRAVGGFDGVDEGALAWVRVGKGDMAGGVPVLGEEDVVEAAGERVDAGEEDVAFGDGERAAGQEVGLHVDDKQGVGGLGRDRHGSYCQAFAADYTTDMTPAEQIKQRGYAETNVRVRYAETDQMGVVYHANYLVWFEVGRVEFIRQMGLDYSAMEREEGALIAVIEARARYKAPARYDDQLLVRTMLASVRGSVIRFTYAILRAEAETLLCEGETVHMVVGRDMKRRALPARYADRFRGVLGQRAGMDVYAAAESSEG